MAVRTTLKAILECMAVRTTLKAILECSRLQNGFLDTNIGIIHLESATFFQ